MLRVFHAESLLPTSTPRFIVLLLLFTGVALVVAPIVKLLPYRRLDHQLTGLFLLRRFARDNRMRVKLEWAASVASVRAAGNSVPGFPGTIFAPSGGRATRATVWRRITQTVGLLVLLAGPAVLFVAAAQTPG